MTGPESVAIIGLSGRFPKSRNVDTFWRNIRDGVECISFFSEADLIDAGMDPAEIGKPGFVNAGAVLEDLDQFDASFFGYSPRDAEIMDPQQRVFLEAAFHALEDAAYNPFTYDGLIGVFAGSGMSSYLLDLYADPALLAQLDDFQVAVGNDKDHLATQVSYKLNLRGPSVAIQTACSTSLVAVCMGCQSLLTYQCDMALAGGVSADAYTSKGYYYQPGGILSPDGHCRVFDAASKGTVIGNGVGVAVLKRLSEAIADGDHIRAVIKGFALNNDGSQKVGYTAPSVDGQAQVIALAQALAGVSPETIGYIEAHGTGTELGDPIEMAALNQVFRMRTNKKQFCAIGSVKSNIGHLDTAAGIASLIKTTLALENKALPPSLHFQTPNPRIDFSNSPFYVNTRLADWPSNGHPRRAGVSCFGIGGTNAHVVMEEAPVVGRSREVRPACVLKLSAQSQPALEAMTTNLAEYLAAHSDAHLADVSYTCDVGRKAFQHRRIVVCADLDTRAAAAVLAKRDPLRVFTASCDAKEKQVYFMFPGQGTQRLNTALEIYRNEPEFRAEVDRCSELLAPQLGLDLRHLLYPAEGREADAAVALGRTAVTQPALFTIEYALAKLWISWGVRPTAMIGHSIGEFVAACLSGVFSVEDVLQLVALRGQMMERMSPGAMLAVSLSEHATLGLLSDRLSLAAVNGPSSCVVAGPQESVERLAERLSKTSVPSRLLRTSRAFHSNMMDDVVGPFVQRVRSIRLQAPQIPFQSNVTGNGITAAEATDPGYWGRQLRQTVRFGDGLQQLSDTKGAILLEVGPGQTLGNLARQHPGDLGWPVVIASMSTGEQRELDLIALLTARGKLWLNGVEGESNRFYACERLRRVSLPGYPFERKGYWLEPSAQDRGGEEATVYQAARGAGNWFYYPSWKPAPPISKSETAKGSQRWLVFSDGEGVASRLVHQLNLHGEHFATVVPGDEFARLNDRTYTIRPGQATDYALLMEEEITTAASVTIIHCWSLTLPTEPTSQKTFEESETLGFDSIVYLAQALAKHYLENPIRIYVVSNGLYAVTGAEPISPAKALVLGPCRVIPQEYPNIQCQNIDLDLYEKSEEKISEIAGYLQAEITSAMFEPAVGWRKGRRWIQTFESVHLPERPDDSCAPRSGGVYLITGGLGKIGLTLAESLARTAQAKLILTGRSNFPLRDQWDKWLNESPSSAISEKIRRLQLIDDLGAEVLTFQVDSADFAEMQRVVHEAEQRFGPLNGVIHGAGNTSRGHYLSETTRDSAAQHFHAKAAGLIVLDELIAGKELDFVLLLSSLSSILGGLGLAAYSAGNLFMDAWAIRRNQEGLVPWISVNWDAWEFPEYGESASEENGISPEMGADAFLRILARLPRQVIVSISDLHVRLKQWVAGDRDAGDASQEQRVAPRHSRPANLTSTFATPRGEAEHTLVEIWQQLLGITPIGIFDSFFELGGHSLLAIQLISRIRESFRIEVEVRKVFEAPTIAELAASIETHRAPAREGAATADLLTFVEQLSDSEIAALLGQEKFSQGNDRLKSEANGYNARSN
jgi:acyl transferase domain-containing protein/acyl carrier protein